MVIRDQHLTPAQYVAAARLFGDTDTVLAEYAEAA